jgi:hypothetical protein
MLDDTLLSITADGPALGVLIVSLNGRLCLRIGAR